jgi:hypothetical protein
MGRREEAGIGDMGTGVLSFQFEVFRRAWSVVWKRGVPAKARRREGGGASRRGRRADDGYRRGKKKKLKSGKGEGEK